MARLKSSTRPPAGSRPISNDQWAFRFLERFVAAGYPREDVYQLIETQGELAQLRQALGEDPEAAAEYELTFWGDGPGIQ